MENVKTLRGFKMFYGTVYPCVVRSNNPDDEIVVEPVPVHDTDHLARLDAYEGFYEGHPEASLFVREEVLGGDMPVWIYLYANRGRFPGDPPMSSPADWLKETGQSKGHNAQLALNISEY
jgi:gamma-glutamylcyclotransferase (GGCT)/AIG2-like uncharacterized protein YtfP